MSAISLIIFVAQCVKHCPLGLGLTQGRCLYNSVEVLIGSIEKLTVMCSITVFLPPHLMCVYCIIVSSHQLPSSARKIARFSYFSEEIVQASAKKFNPLR